MPERASATRTKSVGSLLLSSVKRCSIARATGALRAAGPTFNCAISSFNQSRHTMRNERVQELRYFAANNEILPSVTQTPGVRLFALCVCDCDCIMRDGVARVLTLFAKHIVRACGCIQRGCWHSSESECTSLPKRRRGEMCLISKGLPPQRANESNTLRLIFESQGQTFRRLN